MKPPKLSRRAFIGGSIATAGVLAVGGVTVGPRVVDYFSNGGDTGDIVYGPFGRLPYPDVTDWPLITLETPDNAPRAFLDRANDLACAFQNNPTLFFSEDYATALVLANFHASYLKPPSLMDFALDLTPEETFDYLCGAAEAESRFGRQLTPYNGEDDETGLPRISGPFHFRSFNFAAMMGVHGPESFKRLIEIGRSEDGDIDEAVIDESDPATRPDILALRNDPFMAAMMKVSSLYELTDNLRRALTSAGYTDFKIGPNSLYCASVLGQDDGLKLIRAKLDGQGSALWGTVADDPQNGVSAETITQNPSLFHHAETGDVLTLGQSFERFKTRIQENQAAMLARAGQATDPRRQDPNVDYKSALFDPPYFIHNAQTAERERLFGHFVAQI